MTRATTAREPIACTQCGAPEGARVIRLIANPIQWSLDTDLAGEHPGVWRWPNKIVLHKNGRCVWCDHPSRPWNQPTNGGSSNG